jgi:hypothetical protein
MRQSAARSKTTSTARSTGPSGSAISAGIRTRFPPARRRSPRRQHRVQADATRVGAAVWEASFNEVIVNGALMASGATVALSPEMVVFQHRSDLALGDALRERYIWGRSYAEARSRELGAAQRAVHAVASPILPLVLMGRIAATAWSRRRHVREFMRCAPLIALLTLCWCVGEGTGYAAARRPAG